MQVTSRHFIAPAWTAASTRATTATGASPRIEFRRLSGPQDNVHHFAPAVIASTTSVTTAGARTGRLHLHAVIMSTSHSIYEVLANSLQALWQRVSVARCRAWRAAVVRIQASWREVSAAWSRAWREAMAQILLVVMPVVRFLRGAVLTFGLPLLLICIFGERQCVFSAEGGLRLIGVHRDSAGRRFISPRKAVDLFKESKFSNLTLQRPTASKEWLLSVRDATADLVTYNTEWARKSVASSKSAVARIHEIVNLDVSERRATKKMTPDNLFNTPSQLRCPSLQLLDLRQAAVGMETFSRSRWSLLSAEALKIPIRSDSEFTRPGQRSIASLLHNPPAMDVYNFHAGAADPFRWLVNPLPSSRWKSVSPPTVSSPKASIRNPHFDSCWLRRTCAVRSQRIGLPTILESLWLRKVVSCRGMLCRCFRQLLPPPCSATFQSRLNSRLQSLPKLQPPLRRSDLIGIQRCEDQERNASSFTEPCGKLDFSCSEVISKPRPPFSFLKRSGQDGFGWLLTLGKPTQLTESLQSQPWRQQVSRPSWTSMTSSTKVVERSRVSDIMETKPTSGIAFGFSPLILLPSGIDYAQD